MKKENIRYSLYLILFLSLALRFWGIWNVTTTDEYNEVLEALRVCSGHFNFERWFKRCYLYILAAEYGIYYIIGWIFNTFTSPMDFAEKIVRNMKPLFIIGRVTSAIAGAFTVGILFRIGEKFFSRRAGLIASLLLAFTVFHIYLSQQAKVDALLGLLVVSTFYFILKLLQADTINKWDFIWCGFLMALAVQTKINAVVLIVPLLIAVFRDSKIFLSTVSNILKFFTPAFFIGFVLGNPPVLLAPQKFFFKLSGMGKVYTTAMNIVPNDLIGFLAYPLYYYRTVGPVVSILTIAGILYAILHLNRQRAAILAFIGCFYILMGSSRYQVAVYYMIPAVPFIYLLIGDFLKEMSDKFSSKANILHGKASYAIALILIVALIHPATNVIRHEISLSGKNTRYVAKDWIESNIPFGSKILMDSGKSINSFAPTIAENNESLRRIIDAAKENVVEGKIVHGMVDRNALVYYELLLKTIPKMSYDITSTTFGLDVESIDYYIQNKFEYFIISGGMKKSRTGEYILKSVPEVANFYLSLDSDPRVKLIKTIAPSVKNRGDTFFIYKVIG